MGFNIETIFDLVSTENLNDILNYGNDTDEKEVNEE